jgi:hypothetical protein
MIEGLERFARLERLEILEPLFQPVKLSRIRFENFLNGTGRDALIEAQQSNGVELG